MASSSADEYDSENISGQEFADDDEEMEFEQESQEAELEEGLDANPDEDGGQIQTNIESKRDELLNKMLLKEDLGIIQMRIKDTTKVL